MILSKFHFWMPILLWILTPVLVEKQERISEDAAQFEDHYLQMK